MYEKLKSYVANDAIFMAGLLFGVGVMSFGLGRLSVGENMILQSSPLQVALVANAPNPAPATTSPNTSAPVVGTGATLVADTAPYVGSKSGTKYHLITCAGAKRIKPENKIYFRTTTEAEAAGYSKAANCPGL